MNSRKRIHAEDIPTPDAELPTESLGDFLSALGINYLVGERKLAVANIIGSASGQLFARIRSQECRDIRVFAALLAAHGFELEVRTPSGVRVFYTPHTLPSCDTIARWSELERVRESRRLREESAQESAQGSNE